jgi:hypothetical protein
LLQAAIVGNPASFFVEYFTPILLQLLPIAGQKLKFICNPPTTLAGSLLKQPLFSRKTVQEPCLLVLSDCDLASAFR